MHSPLHCIALLFTCSCYTTDCLLAFVRSSLARMHIYIHTCPIYAHIYTYMLTLHACYAHKSCTIAYHIKAFNYGRPLTHLPTACHSCQSGMWLQHTYMQASWSPTSAILATPVTLCRGWQSGSNIHASIDTHRHAHATRHFYSSGLICCSDEPHACIFLHQMLAPSHRAQVLF